jgi:hypothetical protein
MRVRLAVGLLATACAAPAAAQVPAGGEFQINSYIAWNQWAPVIASDAAGNFVLAWNTDTQDGSGFGIFARRFASSGAPLGDEFQVNAYTTGRQAGAAVASDGAGNFAVAWMSEGQDGSDRGVFARRFLASGVALGSEFQVNTYTTGGQGGVAVAVDPARNFVIAWSGAGEGDSYGVFARRYDATGAPRGGEFRVNSYTLGYQGGASVAATPGGAFVVAWLSDFDAGTSQFGIFARRYDAGGTPIGAEFRVNTPGAPDFLFLPPSVAADATGGFVVAWTKVNYWIPAAPPGQGHGSGESGVFVRRYDAAGTPLTGDITVTTSFLTDHWSAVTTDAAGNFVVAWDKQHDGSGSGVFARRFDASGTPRGAVLRMNSYTSLDQMTPALASDPAGNLFAAWISNGQDGDLWGVFGQRYGGIIPSALRIDTVPSGSDGNGVLEPGEQADVRPSWQNVNGDTQSFTGTGVGISGPAAAGVSYRIIDGAGSYGALVNGQTAECADCYRVEVSYAGNRPAVHWDATFTERLVPDALGQVKRWPLHVGESFADVPRTSLFYGTVETLLHRGVTAGCGGGAYCPLNAVTREQMAAFALPAKEGAGYMAPACSPPNLFADVPETSPFCDVIEELARRGVVGGCGAGSYCPTAAVTREQMPVFMLRLLDPALNPPACTTPMFGDVPAGSPFCPWIEELARRGVVAGCGGGNYCPAAPVTREQMAVFLTGTFGLRLYGP